MDNETIAFVIRETGWTLEYIRSLPVSVFYALVDELAYQKAVRDYWLECNFATVMATMINLWSKRRVTAIELVGELPKRSVNTMVNDKILAKGVELNTIVLSDGKEYELAQMTINLASQVEDKFDMSFFELISKRRISHIRFIIYLRLRAKYPDLTEEKVGDLVTFDVLKKIAKLYGLE